jgi:hypothetical protein
MDGRAIDKVLAMRLPPTNPEGESEGSLFLGS